MHRKASMELSVNSIVILVIAVVMMGLILGFIRSKFNQISPDLASKEPDAPSATSAEPITISNDQKVITAGNDDILKVNVYNTQAAAVADAVLSITCTPANGPTFVVSTTKKTIDVGGTAGFTIPIKTVKTTAKDLYLCTITVLNTLKTIPGKDFSVQVQ